ncbi:MAG: prephenate dehydratase domain-containing protein [archaeon]|nr:prephenate dehydratase domain-containing protein [archaeon]
MGILKKITIGYYGNPGSFSEEGAFECFTEQNVHFVPCGKSIEAVFSKVVIGEVDYGIVPVENSNHGIINETYDLLLQEKVYIVRETISRIQQSLLANKGVGIDQLKRVYSHVVAISQCKDFLKAHTWEVIPLGDTATCAEKIKKEKSQDAGAIASKRAAQFYDLEILEDIAVHNDIYTRFFGISKKLFESKGDKTSIALGLRDGLNSLYDYMGFFVKRDIKIVKLESRPIKNRPFEYILYMDFLGDPREGTVKDALNELLLASEFVKVLGTYKAATLPP